MFKFSNLKYIVCVLVAIVFVSLAMDRPPQGGGWWQSLKSMFSRSQRIAPVNEMESAQNELMGWLYSSNINQIERLINKYPTLLNYEFNFFHNRYRTPLMLALENRKLEVASKLVELGANVNYRNQNGQTALMIAALEGNAAMAQFLVDRGADVNFVNKQESGEETALQIAIVLGDQGPKSIQVLRILLDNGADISDVYRKTFGDRTILEYASPQIRAILNEYLAKKKIG